MDFFEHQTLARRRSAWLALAFLAAAGTTVAAVALLAGIAWLLAAPRLGMPGAAPTGLASVPDAVYAWSAGLALAVVGIATLRRLWALTDAGPAVARMLGARPLAPDSSEAGEQRLRNVVEEMALAAGAPVPRIYVIDGEPAINALAAGHNPRHAAIVVTDGALAQLTRDELQGIAAHEMSHIVHGDMRLNVRLVALLGGLGALGELGLWLLRGSFASGRRRGGLPQLAAGLGLLAVGSAGVLAGRVLRAGIAREREFLADASAVQYTRNPAGIGGALQRIRLAGAARLRARHHETVAHMLFGGDGAGGPRRWLASHPPIDARIARVFRVSDARFAPLPPARQPPPGTPARAPAAADPLLAAAGTVSAAGLALTHAWLERLPEGLRAAARRPERVAGLICALLLDAEPQLRATQLGSVRTHLGEEMAERTERLAGLLAQLPRHEHLPLLELCLPALQDLEGDAVRALPGALEALLAADGRVSQYEYLLYALAWRALPGRRRHAGRATLAALAAQCQLALSSIAATAQAPSAAFAAGWSLLGLDPAAPIAPALIHPQTLARALDDLARLRPAHLARLARGCAAVALHDGTVPPLQAAALHTVCATLDVPLPPLLTA